jgi:adenylate kinase
MDVVAKPLRVVLLGPPASGKGTQGRRLATSLHLGYLSTGALLREHVGSGTELGKEAAPILARGEYLPDELMFPILADWLSKQTSGWVLDGFPRSLPQAIFLDEWLAERGAKIDVAISLEVPFNELISRIRNRVECPQCRWSGQRNQLKAGDQCPVCAHIASSRSDDSEENFCNRHAEFQSLTGPVIAHYRQLGLLNACDATAPQDEVATHLLEQFSASVASL